MAEGTPRQTTPTEPVHLLEPTPPVKPVPGCNVCAALDRQRADAARAGEWSQATDYSVEMCRHAHEGQQ
ncbi:hypothetical protein [Streptomyces sp. NPDC018000]|uniref:hypothetical protein n=1 Tax=Streptomyces sp. NPDC018000 TaxID=3365028 RepID=UPI0037A7D888